MRKLKKSKRIGILGGTFDPPHKGHLHIAKIALKKFKLNYLLWIMTKQNPLKTKPYLSENLRIDLIKDMLKGQKKMLVKCQNKNIKSTNTFDLLKYLKSKNKESEFYFIIGADNLIKFHKWKNWKKIPKLAKLIIFARPNYSTKALNSIASKKLKKEDWFYINSKKVNISSSLIRKF